MECIALTPAEFEVALNAVIGAVVVTMIGVSFFLPLAHEFGERVVAWSERRRDARRGF